MILSSRIIHFLAMFIPSFIDQTKFPKSPFRALFFWTFFPKKTLFWGFSARSAEFFWRVFGVFLGFCTFLRFLVFFFFFFFFFFFGGGGVRREAPKNAKNCVFRGFFEVFFSFF